MHITAVSPMGGIALATSPSERLALEAEALGWFSRKRDTVETKMWYLPAIKAAGFDLQGLRDHGPQLLALRDWLQKTPTPTEPEYDLDLSQRDYQRPGAGLLRENEGAILADDVGLGKTIMSATVMGRRLLDGGSGIIVTTLGTKMQWREEIEDNIMSSCRPTIYMSQGTKAQRYQTYQEWSRGGPRPLLLLHHDSMRRDVEKLIEVTKVARLRHPTLTFNIDEASVIRNSESKGWAAAIRIGANVTHRIALTATPLENGLEDLWSIVTWVRPGYLGPKDNFDRRHIERVWIQPRYGQGFWKVLKYKHIGEIRPAIRRIYLRRTAGEVKLSMPKIVTVVRSLEMGTRQRALYERIKRDKAESRIGPKEALAMLRQVCNDPTTIGEKGESPKLDEIEEICQQWLRAEKVIFFTDYRKFAVKIMERIRRWKPILIASGVTTQERDHARRMFQKDPNTRCLVMTSAGERGLNLQAGSILVNCELPWNPAKYRQRVGRIFRMDSLNDCIRIFNLMMHNTVEDKVAAALGFKQDLFDKVIDTVTEDDVRDTLTMTTTQALALA